MPATRMSQATYRRPCKLTPPREHSPILKEEGVDTARCTGGSPPPRSETHARRRERWEMWVYVCVCVCAVEILTNARHEVGTGSHHIAPNRIISGGSLTKIFCFALLLTLFQLPHRRHPLSGASRSSTRSTHCRLTSKARLPRAHVVHLQTS